MLGDSQRAVGGEITVFNKAWNGLGKVPSSARYQGKAHDGACVEWVYF